MEVVVFGNATLDIICKPVDDVPRYESISFDEVVVAPGGCASNVALWLGAMGVPTGLNARIGNDRAAFLVEQYWESIGLDLTLVKHTDQQQTGTSVALVDSNAQPRFIHTSGANAELTIDDLNVEFCAQQGVKLVHVAGFFVLPGLMDGRLPGLLESIQDKGILTTLDVVRSYRMNNPEPLLECLPYLDIFMCNSEEAERITGEKEPERAARTFINRGLRIAIVKLGKNGCWLESENLALHIPAPEANTLDTTGAGDAFAAGLIAGILKGKDLPDACRCGNEVGAHAVEHLGAVGPWLDPRIR